MEFGDFRCGHLMLSLSVCIDDACDDGVCFLGVASIAALVSPSKMLLTLILRIQLLISTPWFPFCLISCLLSNCKLMQSFSVIIKALLLRNSETMFLVNRYLVKKHTSYMHSMLSVEALPNRSLSNTAYRKTPVFAKPGNKLLNKTSELQGKGTFEHKN
ncbi:hypothetical protein QVD17_10975 [Tagetes erecta]|uniref:Uncharacterized protein n=1 Tax=Tagetes erecta TaxID=13708 RepID=A0AAD8P6P3_TARER|nr:hypothetical protein QVD17_10975 [Tagetes erecta]